MAENLKTTRYRDSTSIQNVTGKSAWNNLTSGAYCDYENDSIKFRNISTGFTTGMQFNNPRNIYPEGWHVATDEDWETLSTYLGGDSIAGGKLKETGTMHWKSPNLLQPTKVISRPCQEVIVAVTVHLYTCRSMETGGVQQKTVCLCLGSLYLLRQWNIGQRPRCKSLWFLGALCEGLINALRYHLFCIQSVSDFN